jgi:hypothetical protein
MKPAKGRKRSPSEQARKSLGTPLFGGYRGTAATFRIDCYSREIDRMYARIL